MKNRMNRFCITIVIFWSCIVAIDPALSQDEKKSIDINTTWLKLQTVPNITWTSFPHQTNFAFEWEIAPVIYSFGMAKRNQQLHFFKVTQTERFSGSIEFNTTLQLFMSKAGRSHWGFSGQLLAHLPLIEYGENLGMNLGVARYSNSIITSNYIIAGFSTLFGFFHYNIKYSPSASIWMHSIEFRFF